MTSQPASLDTVTIGGWTGAEPDIIYFSGDNSNSVSNITWTSWNDDSALGHGVWNYEDCVPNCAEGSVTPYGATLMLSNPADDQFTSLTEDQSGPHGNTSTYTLPDRDLGGASKSEGAFPRWFRRRRVLRRDHLCSAARREEGLIRNRTGRRLRSRRGSASERVLARVGIPPLPNRARPRPATFPPRARRTHSPTRWTGR